MAEERTALALLREELRGLESRRESLVKAIRELEKFSGDGSGPSLDFEGLKVEPAVVKLLKHLGRPAHLYQEILPALQRGGCHLGAAGREARVLKTTVRMNSKASNRLLYDDKSLMVALRGGKKK